MTSLTPGTAYATAGITSREAAGVTVHRGDASVENSESREREGERLPVCEYLPPGDPLPDRDTHTPVNQRQMEKTPQTATETNTHTEYAVRSVGLCVFAFCESAGIHFEVVDTAGKQNTTQ